LGSSNNMKHPKEILPESRVQEIRNYTFETEAAGSLPKVVLNVIYDQQWFQLLVPKAFGGKELALPEAVRLFEAITWADANVGWCVNLGAGANMFSGYLDEAVANSIFNSTKTCCAGSGAISGKATKTQDGYFLTGRWKYASGANHATHFTANAYLLDENGNNIIEDGMPVFRSFIIPAGKIVNHKNWNAVGLSATSSNDFEAINVFVPFEHTFTLLKPSAFAQGSVYKFPFYMMAVVNMTCMITGIALHFLDLYEELAATKKPLHSDLLLKDNSVAVSIYEKAANDFHKARNLMYEQLESVWKYYEQGREADEESLNHLRKTNNRAAKASRELINALYPLCGMNAVFPQSELNKVWRDAAVASQHYLLSPLQQVD
jgi:alkylation response protein AidB-like acyl-CoA dehydrogenase